MSKRKRYTFFGKKIKYTKKQEKPVEIEEETKAIDFSMIWMVIIGLGLFFVILVMFSILPDIIDSPSNDEYYTIQVYVPDCDNGALIFEKHSVSGQYLLDSDLATYAGILNDELKPVVNYQRWEKYVIQESGHSIPGDNCCVNFIKE